VVLRRELAVTQALGLGRMGLRRADASGQQRQHRQRREQQSDRDDRHEPRLETEGEHHGHADHVPHECQQEQAAPPAYLIRRHARYIGILDARLELRRAQTLDPSAGDPVVQAAPSPLERLLLCATATTRYEDLADLARRSDRLAGDGAVAIPADYLETVAVRCG
jgi:hypothetical protein